MIDHLESKSEHSRTPMLRVRRAAAVTTLAATALGLAGCTPEGLMVFGRTPTSDDVPLDFGRSILPAVADDDFRLLGTIDDATYYAVVLKGSADPWCLLQVDLGGTAAASCAANPRVVSYASGNVVALSNESPDEAHVWNELETSFWVAALP